MKKECVPDSQLSFRIALSISVAAFFICVEFCEETSFRNCQFALRFRFQSLHVYFEWIFVKRRIFEGSG